MRIKVLQSLILVFFGLTTFTSTAQIAIRNLQIQSYIIEDVHHVRVDRSDTFNVTDTVDGRVISFNYLNHNRELIGDYSEYKLHGSKLVQASLGGNYTTFDELSQNLFYYCDGQYSSWYNNGQRSGQAMYKDGQLNGMKKVWDVNGTLVSEEFFKKGHQDSINQYYHPNSCKVKAFLKCEADNYDTDTLVFKEISRNGLLTNWYVNDSMIYRWNEKKGSYIKMYNSNSHASSEKWLTATGILQNLDSFSYSDGISKHETASYSRQGILQNHKLKTSRFLNNISSDTAVLETNIKEWNYNTAGVLLDSSLAIRRDTIQDETDDFPEETDEVFESFLVSAIASPVGGLYALEESLNKMPKSVKIRKRSYGVYFVDVTVSASGKIKKVSWVDNSSVLTNLSLKQHMNRTLLSSKWKPYVNRNGSIESVYRLTLSIKDPNVRQ